MEAGPSRPTLKRACPDADCSQFAQTPRGLCQIAPVGDAPVDTTIEYAPTGFNNQTHSNI